MKLSAYLVGLTIVCFNSYAKDKEVFLSCPHLDERAKDLIVILDNSNGTASLQSPSMGKGLNFVSDASFGPNVVTWRNDNRMFKQTYSVDRTTLEIQRKTFSETTEDTHIDKSACTLLKKIDKAKF